MEYRIYIPSNEAALNGEEFIIFPVKGGQEYRCPYNKIPLFIYNKILKYVDDKPKYVNIQIPLT